MTQLEVELLFGPSGAGKSTIARHVEARELRQVFFVGDKCRQLAQQGRLSAADTVAIETGVPLSVAAINLALDELSLGQKPTMRVLIDGPPRSEEQARSLAARFRISRIYRLIVPDAILVARLIARYRTESRADDLPAHAKAKIFAFRDQEDSMLENLKGIPTNEIRYPASYKAVLQVIRQFTR
ncbi:hypothetical protein EN851_05310 [Mesorhizobium sp. M8A.F.Ca.ET.208.01.1.1]|uniref:nucleoside monophosphate kinase n=1 Tax=unclassified Mesorhizobium TaxID=325217 RepID=UPI001093B5E1|nr:MULTISPECIES: nucleoside monophosphate kinase [unclassified Mesorhizobium]TGQ94969.1 hypothetical protein EN851_05310 [Mesorhizobium sp. M8A.F.Ca.ET.208.01.1.1]TGT55458.1 hypothetical protein EN810_05310 [Mesorhizobium sp. M8A.F.Ca.ET.167.01.1.1]